MPGPTKNTSIPDIEALLEQGWNILLNTPEQLKDIAATVQVFTDRMKKSPQTETPKFHDLSPQIDLLRYALLLSGLQYLLDLYLRTRTELEEVNLNYDEVLGLLTHEFKNLLSTLNGYQRLLEQELTTIERPDLLAAHQAGSRIVKKLFNILDSLMKFYQNDRKLLRPDYKLTEFEEDILIPLENEYKSDLISRNLKLKRTAKGPRKMINVDAQLIEIAVRNLIENAMKYSDPHTTIRVIHSFSDQNLFFSIKSFNKAIPKDLCQGIFEKFKTKKIGDAKTGTGIGLYNVHNIVNLHHGTVECQVKTGKWILFRLRIPVNLV
jgi:signal transduction histidine kinase